MLYVFQVDVGTMMTFEMDIVLKSVSTLKQAIAVKCQIPADKQVLLVSGGDSLDDECRVSQYSAAGTDTNPIFLFNKSRLEQQQLFNQWQQQQAQQQQLQQQQLQAQVKRLKQQIMDRSLQPSFETVVRRTETAKELHQLTREMQYACECLLRDQHLQYQGWAAVIANLEDITTAFRDSSQYLQSNFSAFLNKRPQYIQLLNDFDKDLEDLADIQVPVELLQLDELSPNQDTCSLLDWISQKDRQCSLRQMADQCLQAVTQLDEQALSDLREESDRILQLVENDQNKKIKKIECRLHELDKMLSVCKKLLNDQELLTAAFVSHQQSAHSLQDPSIFPDLCDSHTTQLQLMFNNYLHMTAIAKKFNAAKMELVHNLHTRLRVIVTCETELSDIRWKIFVYGENLKKLKRNLEVLEQVNAAPDVYNAAIREINRRQHFSTRFRRWSTALAEFGQRLYQQECERRESFRQVLDGHFLKAIFTGLDDELPKFAVTKPPEFDLHLPNVPTDDSVDLVHFPKVSCPLCTDDEPNTSQEIDDKKADLCSQSVLMNSNQASDMKVASDSGTVAETAIATKIEKSAMDLDVQSGACGVPKATEKSVEKKTEDLNLIEKSVVENKTDCDMEQRLRKEYESKMADMQAEMNAKLEQEKARIHEEFMASATSPAITFATKLNQSQSTIIKSGAESDSGEPPMNANGTVGSATATTGSTTGRKCNAKMKTKKAQQLIETLKQANRDKQLLIDQLSAKQQVTSNVLAKIKRTLASVESHGTTSSSSLDPWMLCKTVCQEIAAFGELDQI